VTVLATTKGGSRTPPSLTDTAPTFGEKNGTRTNKPKCPCAGCRAGLHPFTVSHFQIWAGELELDTGEAWELEPFQILIVADIFAGFREIWAIIPEGNAKTTLMGGIGLYHADHTWQPWVPIGAAAREQAEIMFGQMAGFIERSPALQERFRVYEGYRKIKCWTGGRGIKVYAWDPKTGDGVLPTLALVDELHRHDDLRLYRLWKGKLGKRNGQIVTISTAGEPGSPFEEQRETIRNKAIERTRDGCYLRAQGNRLAYHEWMVPDATLATDLEVVKQANPLSMIDLEWLEEKLLSETLDFGEDWLRLTCNIPTRSQFAAIPEPDWDGCESEERIPEGAPVAVGADFAWIIDTTALVPFWVKSSTERYFGDPEILTPPRDGSMLDVEDVHAAFRRIAERNPVELVVMDSSKAKDTAQWIASPEGLNAEVVDRSQGNTLQAEDYAAFMEALGNKWFKHTGHREFRRHVLNAIARRMEGERHRFDRPSSSRNTRAGRQERRVIDALTAAAMVNNEIAGGTGGGVVY
jgi:phage terminase large subunit-like protein